MATRLTGIYVYPIKSCAAIALQHADVDSFGLRHDRRFMLVGPDGQFLSLRRHPRLALARPRFDTHDTLIVEADGRPTLRLPLTPDGAAKPAAVCVWGEWVDARLVSAEADQWFTALLGSRARLMWMPPDTFRAVDPDYGTPQDRVSFADGFSFLLIGEASLGHLVAHLPKASHVTMANFRPNLVVDTTEPFAEDDWRRILIGQLAFDVVKPCARCVAVTIDPATSDRVANKEPLATLARLRTIDGKVLFGQNLIHRGTGRLALGDVLTERL